MSATRTQIYLTEEQRRRIDARAGVEGLTLAEFIRRAVDAYLGVDPDPTAALAATFGADPDAGVPGRDGWDRA
jgi:hypothetical protein